MERTEVNVTAKISLHDVLNALALLANVYPMERVAEYQIERIEASARVLRERMKDYKEEKVKKQKQEAQSKPAEFGVFITPAMPSGWSYTSAVPVAEEAKVDLQWNSASSAKTVMNRRMGPITRRKHSTFGPPARRAGKGRRKDDVSYRGLPYADIPYRGERRVKAADRRTYNACGSPSRRSGKGRREGDAGYSTLPYSNCSICSLSTLLFGVERRVNAPSRRKVNDYAHPNRTRRIASYGPNGRRSTDRESYTMLPAINVPPPMVETNQDRTKRRQ